MQKEQQHDPTSVTRIGVVGVLQYCIYCCVHGPARMMQQLIAQQQMHPTA
jgi:hypothetical protein